MSRLQQLLAAANTGDSSYIEIAAQCGPAEFEEINVRIAELRAEWEAVEEWDGDTKDDIWFAIEFFERLRLLAMRSS